MAANVGDQVRFLNETGGGKIIRIKGNYAYVLTNDGFEIPVLLNELVVVEKAEKKAESKPVYPSVSEGNINVSYNYIEREETEYPEELLEINDESDEYELYLAFLPENRLLPDNSPLQMYLVNDGAYYIYYSLAFSMDEGLDPIESGTVEPHTKVMVGTVLRQDIARTEMIHVDLLFYKYIVYKAVPPFSKDIKIRASKLLQGGAFVSNDYFDENAYLVFIDRNPKDRPEKLDIKQVIAQKEKILPDKSKRFKRRPEPTQIEFDLHIHELVDNVSGMSNGEMLTIQLAKFRDELESAIRNKVHRIVFIHGVGNGTLKLQLRKQIDDYYPHLKYQDASFQEYGYGATLVVLR